MFPAPEMPVRYAARLRRGDTVRVVAPSQSRAVVSEHDHTDVIRSRFAALGLHLTYGRHVDECDDFDSAAISSRVEDLHDAFADPQVAAIVTVIGGFNANELLPDLDWQLIAANPKIFCGYSDITALLNAILARTGLVTYLGPHWSSFGMRDHFDLTQEWFARVVMSPGDQARQAPIEMAASATWTDDAWFLDQDDRRVRTNDGWWALQPGVATGRVVGGNLCTLNLLQGTPYMPSLDGAVLVVEDDAASDPATFARDLTSLLQLPDAAGIRGLVIGRFQDASRMTRSILTQIVSRQAVLVGRPVLAGVDVGHTSPMVTLPIGGTASLDVGGPSRLVINSY